MKDHRVVAIIPARGGSKNLPRKNIRMLAGHPLIAYSIAAGQKSQLVQRVLVSTDDEEISQIARQYGAEVPFLRPASLAGDETADLPVFQHALDWLEKNETYIPDIVVQLRPTSPIRPPGCIDEAVEQLLRHPTAASVRGVIPSGQNPYKMWRINEDGRLEPLLADGFDEPYNMPRQKLPQTYWQTGHIDAIRRETIASGSMSGHEILPLVLDPRYAIDIDSERDLQRAEWMIRQGDLPFIRPGPEPRPIPPEVQILLLDFDGVLTDNRVWVNGTGDEWVAANRGDGWGIARLKEKGVQIAVLSTETNPVVSSRCRKMGVECFQDLEDKASAVEALLAERSIKPENAIFIGNDENDISAFSKVACALVVQDAHPSALAKADIILKHKGGYGAVREVCDMLIPQAEAD